MKILPITSINVEWDGGLAEGFPSKEAADRFIEKICEKVAPGKYCGVMNRTSYG